MVDVADVDERTLTAQDRCDKCGARALYLVIFDFGNLVFCRHHFLANETALRDIAFYVLDEKGEAV